MLLLCFRLYCNRAKADYIQVSLDSRTPNFKHSFPYISVHFSIIHSFVKELSAAISFTNEWIIENERKSMEMNVSLEPRGESKTYFLGLIAGSKSWARDPRIFLLCGSQWHAFPGKPRFSHFENPHYWTSIYTYISSV